MEASNDTNEAKTDTNETQALTALANPHVLWRQVVGFVFSTGVVGFVLYGPTGVVSFEPLSAAMNLALGGVTFADAWRSGIYKDPEKKSLWNISPMVWGIAMMLLFIVVYPVYLIKRNKLRTIQAGNGFFITTIVLGALVIVLAVINILVTGVGAVT